MSVNYASGLSAYEHKGKCGMPETFDSIDVFKQKVHQLAEWVKASQHMVVITGAGISTSAGIPDFRGPKGVWTLEEKGESPQMNVTFDTAKPTFTHLALVALEEKGYLKYVISQNVDGLHVRSGFPRNRLAELHGNMFVEQCERCRTQYIRSHVVPTMALNYTGNKCSFKKPRSSCRGKLRDTILDWEDNLPDLDLDLADQNCRKSDLCLCLGTSLQIVPCGNMPLLTKKNQGKICIVNLQSTKQDKKCDLKIHYYSDEVLKELCNLLNVTVPKWTQPTVVLQSSHTDSKEEKSPHIFVDPVLLRKLESKVEAESKHKIKTENIEKEKIHLKPEIKHETINNDFCVAQDNGLRQGITQGVKNENEDNFERKSSISELNTVTSDCSMFSSAEDNNCTETETRTTENQMLNITQDNSTNDNGGCSLFFKDSSDCNQAEKETSLEKTIESATQEKHSTHNSCNADQAVAANECQKNTDIHIDNHFNDETTLASVGSESELDQVPCKVARVNLIK